MLTTHPRLDWSILSKGKDYEFHRRSLFPRYSLAPFFVPFYFLLIVCAVTNTDAVSFSFP